MTETTAPTPPTGAGTTPRRLVRTPDKKIAGVGAGIAHYLGLDPAIVRIAFILLVFAGGIGLLLYVACWIAMPKGEAPPAPDGAPSFDPWLLGGVAALVVGIALLFDGPSVGPGFQVAAGVALLAGGVWLLVRDRRDGGEPPVPVHPSSAPTSPAPSAASPPAPAGTSPAPALPLAAAGAPVTTTTTAGAPDDPRRGALTAGVLSVLAIGAALVIAGALAGWFELTASIAIAAALVVIGAGLVLASVLGGAPWLLAIGVLLTGGLLATATVEPLVEDGVGERDVRPASVADLETRYAFGIGAYTLDLRDLAPSAGTRRVEVELGIGELVVIVAPDTTAVVDASVRAGTLRFPDGRVVEGWREEARHVQIGTSGGRLLVDASLGMGDLEVRNG